MYLDESKRLTVVKSLELGFVHNLRANLKYYSRQRDSALLSNTIKTLNAVMKEINEAKTLESLLLIEARARQHYYQMFNEIIDNKGFAFTSRTKRPPKDPLNALISFGNTYLYNRIATEINKTTLDIRIGFVHATNSRCQSLNLDIADIFKPLIVDRAIFTLINKNMIDSNMHFEKVENGGVYLNRPGKRLFINELDNKIYQKQTNKNTPTSYDTKIRNELSKIYRLICYGEAYKPFKYF